MKINITKRLLSLLICLAMVLSFLPALSYGAQTGEDTRVADPSTMDSWKEQFLTSPLSTANAGAVWTDKSVFTDASAFDGTGIHRTHDNSFLVALSAMGANMSVTGLTNLPTDTMMILDLSSSMYNGYSRTPATVQTMLSSVNDSIRKLQQLNPHNRVGVTIYFGGENRIQSTSANSMVLLPLDRYTGNANILKANVSGGKLQSIAVNSGVINSAGKTMPQTKRTVTDVAGTYAQLGILDAMNEFLKADTIVPANAEYQADVTRVPVFIFMSDGEPTAGTHEYTKKVDAGMGNNTITIRNPDETDFVTQLTAAYAKKMVDDHYAATTPLFYSLSLGTSVSLAVMDPANHTTNNINGYWTRLLNNGSVQITVTNSPDSWRPPSVRKTYTVSKTTVNGQSFPAGVSQRNYVDKMFTATNAGELTSAFSNVIEQIQLVSEYTPTLITDNADLSGYISFVDKIGKYMNVSDVKGILIDGKLYSGAELSKNFVAGGGNLGSYDNPKPLGDEMVWSVQQRIGLDSTDEARTLIGLAYEHGQLHYDTKTGEYSNYIGWYANAAGDFLGFWHEGIETMPQPSGDPETDPAFIIRSYGYLGAVDADYGVSASDLMYATVQVRESIATGEQSVAFAVPAALIPLISYSVELDQKGNLAELKATGADEPIRLVYEVALDPAITPYTLTELVDPEYLAANTDKNGNVHFYSNQYEADNTTGYFKVNTYSYFNPSRQNDRYYYLQDAPVYADANGTLYKGDAQPSGVFYRRYTVYEKDGDTLTTRTVYRRLSDAALATAKADGNGGWYIGKGNVHVNLEGYTVDKAENPTGTLSWAYIPFVDAHNHSVGDLGYNFIVGATLGNNGRLTMAPATGMILSKAMAQGVDAPEEPFEFVINNLSNPADSSVYTAFLAEETGVLTPTTVTFTEGSAAVRLKAGQSLRIVGMKAGDEFTVTETQTLHYVPLTPTVNVTIADKVMAAVQFVNTDRGVGDLTVSKEVKHTLGADHVLPEGLKFAIDVTLEGVGVANATFAARHSQGTVTTVTTDADGRFTTVLGHHDQLTVLGIPAGVTATVSEPRAGDGFTAAYLENDLEDDGVVTIPKDGIASVVVENRYEPKPVEPVSITLKGTKTYHTPDGNWDGAEFEFQLQKWTEDGWHTIATKTATQTAPDFDFSDAMKQESFPATGTYTYQIMETNGGKTIHGITYDATLHTFGVVVTDSNMDGRLEIDKVISFHTGNAFETDASGNPKIQISFVNRYDASGCDVHLDVQKALYNPSGSPLVNLSGFRFGLYEGDTLVARSELTDGAGKARFLLHYELADEGLHSYTLKEIVPVEKIPGMNYDERSYEVVIEVIDNGDGTTAARVVSIDGKENFETPVFTNRYEPKPVEVPIDFVSKKLTGRDLKEGEFTFQIRGLELNQIVSGTNTAAGAVKFEKNLYFDRIGQWNFELTETSGDGKGITADKTVYHITVTVTDENGQLAADVHVQDVAGDTVTFENTYQPKEVTHIIRGTKKLTGRALLNDEFTFVLKQAADAEGTILADNQWQVRNFSDGTFAFAPLTFYHTGTYYYVVSELAEVSADYGISYDERQYLVTIEITDNAEGALVVSDSGLSILGGDAAEAIEFVNVYEPKPTSVTLGGDKNLIGKVLGGGDYTFLLHASNENWVAGEELDRAENLPDGTFTFDAIDYDTAGTRYYLVREEHGGQIIDGVSYDDTVYRVRVDVTDDLRGSLKSTVTITNSDEIAFDTALFVNTYRITGEVEVTLTGTKYLEGRKLREGEFTFELYETDEAWQMQEAPLTTTHAADGTFTFETMRYEAVGKRFYLIREENGGQTLGDMTYDGTVYRVVVDVTDDGVGNLVADVQILSDSGEELTEITFHNVTTSEDIPKTGERNLMPLLMVMAVCAGGVLTLTLGRKETEEE